MNNTTIKMKPVSPNWTKIEAIGYDPTKEFLFVTINGETLAYKGIEESYYNNILRVNSPAIYIHNHIINSHQGEVPTYESMKVNLLTDKKQ